MTIRWKRADDGYVQSHDGRWRIAPLYCGCTRAQFYELRYDDKVLDSSCANQRDAKETAELFAARGL